MREIKLTKGLFAKFPPLKGWATEEDLVRFLGLIKIPVYTSSQIVNLLKSMTTNKCSVCVLGDGKWNKGRNSSGCENLPVCELCIKDGWEKAKPESILKDPELSKLVNHESPFRNNDLKS